MADIEALLRAAVNRVGRPSSDYDLNPEIRLPEDRRLRDASVLVAVVDHGSAPGLILTKRSSRLKHHPGQVAFPGGKVEEIDVDVSAAALREAHEEIGLPSSEVRLLGTLPPHETVTGFTVTPVISLISPGFVPVPEAGEVAEVFEVPLSHVLDRANYRIEYRRWRGERRYYFTVPWGPYYIWGATARMLRALADRMSDDADRT